MSSEFPPSAAQLGVWYAIKAGTSASAYNIGEYVKIFGAVDSKLFEKALRHVIAEADALRVHFVERDGIPMQAIVTPPTWCMTYQDVSLAANPVPTAVA